MIMLDAWLRSNLDATKRLVRNQDWDYPIVITGPERSGKTALATQIGLYYEGLESDPMKILKHSVWGFEGIESALPGLPKGSAIICHEPNLFGRRSTSKLNVRAMRVFTIVGAYNVLFILTLPSWHDLDRYFRNHRIRAHGRIHTENGQRGLVTWSIRPQGEDIGEDIQFLEVNTHRFESIQGIYPVLWDEIERRDKAYKHAILTMPIK